MGRQHQRFRGLRVQPADPRHQPAVVVDGPGNLTFRRLHGDWIVAMGRLESGNGQLEMGFVDGHGPKNIPGSDSASPRPERPVQNAKLSIQKTASAQGSVLISRPEASL